MSKVRNFAEITPNIGYTEFDFFDLYRSTFENSELGRRSYFTPEGKVALMFLKMYTGLSCPKLMEQLNGNIHY